MAPGKRRKLTEATATCPRLPQSQRGIQAFGRISKSKPQTAVVDVKKGVVTNDIVATSSSPTDTTSPSTPSKRRKLARDGLAETPKASGASTASFPSLHAKSHKSPLPQPSSRPAAVRTSPQKRSPAKSLQTPTKGACDRLALFNLESSSSPIPSTRSRTPPLDTIDTPPTSPCSPVSPPAKNATQASDLPAELQDILDLHSSFLTAVSLHYAHNGMSTPADLKLLMKSIERVWRKRTIVAEDIQLLIGLMNQIEQDGDCFQCNFKLKNFGLGRVVLENAITTQHDGFSLKPFDEEALRDVFESVLCRLWDNQCGNEGNPNNCSAFKKTLPLASITPSSATTSSGSKGQRRLEDLKGCAIRAQEKNATSSSLAIKKDAKGVTSRGKGLMERMKAKQLHQTKLPPPLSKEALSRRSALQKVEDVAGVLRMLKTSVSAKRSHENASNDVELNEKSSFSFPMLVQKVKDSAATPVAREEVEMCLQLLADELAVDWVKSHPIGKLRCIVVYHQKQPAIHVLRKSIAEALQREGQVWTEKSLLDSRSV